VAGQNQASLVVGVERDLAMFNLAIETAGYGSTLIYHALEAAPATLMPLGMIDEPRSYALPFGCP
jgi:hypothetical protein